MTSLLGSARVRVRGRQEVVSEGVTTSSTGWEAPFPRTGRAPAAPADHTSGPYRRQGKRSAGSPSSVRGRGCDGRARRGGSGGSPSQSGRSPSTSVTVVGSRGRRSRGGRAGRAGPPPPVSSAAGFGGPRRGAARPPPPLGAGPPPPGGAADT